MIALLLSTFALAKAPACEGLHDPGEVVQVAWISPVRERVRANESITVVRVEALRNFQAVAGRDPVRTLQALGLVGKRAGWRADRLYKVAVFEVTADQLCRPVDGATPGEVVSGVPACARAEAGACGYTKDTVTKARGIEVYEITWKEASRWGFCLVPLELYLQEI